MIYKTDMHVHSRDISLCADAPVEFIVQKYTEYGYSTVVLCNHFERYTMKSGKDKSYRDFVRRYAAAYEKLKDAAGDRLHVLLGAEVRFDENINDYLLYGVTEEKLLALPDIWKMGVQKLHEAIAGMDMLLVQAHPFRKKMTVTPPEFVDGIEVFNGHPGHNSNNDIAQMWARKYGKIGTSGSDFHDTVHTPSAGILTDTVITNNDQLLTALREKKTSLIARL